MSDEPDPQVVAWMRGYLRDFPSAGQFTIDAAWRATHPYDPVPDGEVMLASWHAVRQQSPETVRLADQGALT